MTTNDAYKLIGGILYETPVDETNGLIDSPNFVAAKVLADRVLNAPSLDDLEIAFNNISSELINYMNSPLVDVLAPVEHAADYIKAVIEKSCDKKYFGGIKFLYDKKFIHPINFKKLIEKTMAFSPYDDFILLCNELAGVSLLETIELTKAAITARDFNKFNYFWLKICTKVCVADIDIFFKLNSNADILQILISHPSVLKPQSIMYCINRNYYGNDIELLHVLFTEYIKIQPISPVCVKSVIDYSSGFNNASIIYYIYENNYESAEFILSNAQSWQVNYGVRPAILDIMEVIIAESQSAFRINYDRLLDESINRCYHGLDSINVLSHFVKNKHKLICELEHYALVALLRHRPEVFFKFIEAGVDIHYNNDIYKKLYQVCHDVCCKRYLNKLFN